MIGAPGAFALQAAQTLDELGAARACLLSRRVYWHAADVAKHGPRTDCVSQEHRRRTRESGRNPGEHRGAIIA